MESHAWIRYRYGMLHGIHAGGTGSGSETDRQTEYDGPKYQK